VLEIRIAQIDRADIRLQPPGHQIDDIVQSLLQIVRPRENLGDVSQKRNTIGNGDLR
jgi:hypothetical protein